MDFVYEFVFELVLGGIFGLTIKNPKIKTRIKTGIFLLLAGAVVSLVLWLASLSASTLVGIVGLALATLFIYTAAEGHKRDWKQE